MTKSIKQPVMGLNLLMIYLLCSGTVYACQAPPMDRPEFGAFNIGHSTYSGGVYVGSPSRISGALTWKVPSDWVYPDKFRLSAHLGLSGGKLSFGRGRFVCLSGVSYNFGFIRTWENPWAAQDNSNYVGAELKFNLFGYNLAVGPYWGISDSSESKRIWVFVHMGYGIY